MNPNQMLGVTGAAAAGLLSLCLSPATGHAQTVSSTLTSLGSPIVSTGNLPVGAVAGVAVGNGVNQSQPIVTTRTPGTTPLVGAGALSGDPDHSGKVVSVSAANSQRLVGVSTGPVGSNGVNVSNPEHAPVLSNIVK